jgi:hypothetical protein
LHRAVDDGLLQPDLIGATSQGQEGNFHATECFGEDDIVVEGAVDDVNTVQVIEGPRGRVLVADQATDFFVRRPKVADHPGACCARRGSNEETHVVLLLLD